MRYHSQHGQDRRVILDYNRKKNGYFVDIGAYDGVELSNTYILERDYQWTGLCVEANTLVYPSLIANRTCICSNDCVSTKDGEEVSFMEGGICSSAIRNEYAAKLTKYNFRRRLVAGEGRRVLKTAYRLETILRKNEVPAVVDYLNLDIDGLEYQILKGFDFSKYRFGMITVEMNNDREALTELLVANGYYFDRRLRSDLVFKHAA